MNKLISVWRYHEAPDHLARLAPGFGGDEDWIIAGFDRDAVDEIATRLAVCNHDIKEESFLGTNFFIATTCHA